jgi:hypothetical protein
VDSLAADLVKQQAEQVAKQEPEPTVFLYIQFFKVIIETCTHSQEAAMEVEQADGHLFVVLQQESITFSNILLLKAEQKEYTYLRNSQRCLPMTSS